MPYYGAEAAIEALDEFIIDGTYGFNAQLATMRSELSVSTGDLPDVELFEKYYPKDLQARSFPHMSMVYLSDTAEQQANSRMINLSVETRLTVLDMNVGGTESAVGLAMCRYRDALTNRGGRYLTVELLPLDVLFDVPSSRIRWRLTQRFRRVRLT